MTTTSEPSLAVACSLREQELAERSREVGRNLFTFAEHVTELPDGYTWRFPGDGQWHASLLEFVATERRCCAFFRIELVFYGVLPTLQPSSTPFGRVYAAYGGVFVVLSLAWGWWIDGVRPDRWDLLGGAIALVGVAVIMYAPRG